MLDLYYHENAYYVVYQRNKHYSSEVLYEGCHYNYAFNVFSHFVWLWG